MLGPDTVTLAVAKALRDQQAIITELRDELDRQLELSWIDPESEEEYHLMGEGDSIAALRRLLLASNVDPDAIDSRSIHSARQPAMKTNK